MVQKRHTHQHHALPSCWKESFSFLLDTPNAKHCPRGMEGTIHSQFRSYYCSGQGKNRSYLGCNFASASASVRQGCKSGLFRHNKPMYACTYVCMGACVCSDIIFPSWAFWDVKNRQKRWSCVEDPIYFRHPSTQRGLSVLSESWRNGCICGSDALQICFFFLKLALTVIRMPDTHSHCLGCVYLRHESRTQNIFHEHGKCVFRNLSCYLVLYDYKHSSEYAGLAVNVFVCFYSYPRWVSAPCFSRDRVVASHCDWEWKFDHRDSDSTLVSVTVTYSLRMGLFWTRCDNKR